MRRLGRTLATGLVVGAAAAPLLGCSPAASTAPGQGPPPAQPELGELNPQFAEMRAFRPYLQVVSVGPFRHHFVAHYTDVEPTVTQFGVRRTVDDVEVEQEWGAWGGLALRSEGPPSRTPKELRDLELAVRKEIRKRRPGVSADIQYIGAYREVAVHEVMPGSPPGPALERPASTVSMVLRVDENFVGVTGVSRWQSGHTRLCWEGHDHVPCHGQASWVPIAHDQQTGRHVLPRLANLEDSSVDELRSALLAVAKREASQPMGEAHTLPDSGGGLLPDPLEVRWRLTTQLYGRVGPGIQQPGATLFFEFDPSEAVFSTATARATASLAGRPFRGEATLKAVEPPTEDGDASLAFELNIVLSDETAGTQLESRLGAQGYVVFENGRAAGLELRLEDRTDTHNGPHHFTFAGFGDVNRVDAYVDTAIWADTGTAPKLNPTGPRQ